VTGHNLKLQTHLHCQSKVADVPNVDLIQETASLVVMLGEEISNTFLHFLENKDFNSFYAPRILSTRKPIPLLAWQNLSESDIKLLTSMLSLTSKGFGTAIEMVQGPCQMNQLAFVRGKICTQLKNLLQLCMSINFHENSRNVVWDGADPISLLKSYRKCLNEIKFSANVNSSDEVEKIDIFLNKWDIPASRITSFNENPEYSPITTNFEILQTKLPYLHVNWMLPAKLAYRSYVYLNKKIKKGQHVLNQFVDELLEPEVPEKLIDKILNPLLVEVDILEKSILKLVLSLLEGGRIDEEISGDILTCLDEVSYL